MLDLDIDPEARLGAAQPRAFPGRRQPRRPRDAAARAGPRRRRSVERILATRRHRRLRLEDVGRLCQLDRQGAAVHRRRRLVAGRPDRSAATCAQTGRTPRAAEPVLMQTARLDLCRARRPSRRRDRFRRLARRRAARWRCAGRRAGDDVAWSRSPASAPRRACSRRRRDRLPAARGAGRRHCTVPRAFVDLRRDGDLPSRPRPLRPALPHAAGGCATSRALLEDRVRSRRPRASRRWRRRCAATSTR